jgi:ribosomal protein L7Ae-like RNA K-turn-binding protein
MSKQKVKSLLGFANRAGKLAIGRSAVYRSHQKGTLSAILLANDASEKIAAMMKDLKIEFFYYSTKDALGQIVGREQVAVIGILDQGFAQSIRAVLIE